MEETRLSSFQMEKLNRLYTDPSNPGKFINLTYNFETFSGGFSSVDNLYREAKKKFPEITRKDVNRFLEGNRTYTLFKPRRIHFKRSKFVPTGLLSDLHVDLGKPLSLAFKI